MAERFNNYNCKAEEKSTPRHPDYDKLKGEFEEIMKKYANNFIWSE
jgi:hypothetical protein